MLGTAKEEKEAIATGSREGEEVNEKGKEREMVGRSVGERGELGTEEGAEEVIISLPCISVLFMQQLLLY